MVKKVYEDEKNAVYYCNEFFGGIFQTYADYSDTRMNVEGEKEIYCANLKNGFYGGAYHLEKDLFLSYADALEALPERMKLYYKKQEYYFVETFGVADGLLCAHHELQQERYDILFGKTKNYLIENL
jgi:hypothetical protein